MRGDRKPAKPGAETPEGDRKTLARAVELARYDLEQDRSIDGPRRAFLRERLEAAERALVTHDQRHPGAALAAHLADGPGHNTDAFLRRRSDLRDRVRAAPSPRPPSPRDPSD